MDVTLSWNLFIGVFFLIIVAYSFVIGKSQTMKVILSSYMAILAADGAGNLLQTYFFGADPVLKVLVVQTDSTGFILLKISIFVFLTVLLTTRGAFHIELHQDQSKFISLFLTGAYGIMSAALTISTILVYISGVSILGASAVLAESPIVSIAEQSSLVRTMVENYSLWFALPAVVFTFSSLFARGEE
ncbi:hypothetical protein HZA38_03930 [Candidatus Peregrinibacteria bacterium]|nr:hypothetical protein [Candidatus Peregrinibacteria bacterium]